MSNADTGRRDALALLLVCAAALATRIPLLAFPRPYGDEIFYAMVGHEWLQGALPYTLVWDVKPPGLFALYALCEAVTRDAFLGPLLLPLLATLASAIGLWRIGRDWFGDQRIGVLAAIFYCANTLALGGAMGASELLLAPFVIFGVLFAARSDRTWPACLAGLLIGCAFTIKQVAAFEGLLGLVFVVMANRGRTRALALRAAGYCLCGALPGAAFALVYALDGQFGLLWEAAVVSALGRTGGDGVSLGEGFLMFLAGFKSVIPLLLAAMVAYLERGRLIAGGGRTGLARCVYWLAASSAGVLAIRAMYAHYFLTLVAPLSLVAAVLLLDLRERCTRRAQGFGLAAALLLVCVYAPAWVTINSEWPTENRNTQALAEHLIALGLPTGPGKSDLFVADHEMATYLLTNVTPPARYAIAQHLTCDFALPKGVSADEIIDRVMDAKPRFVVATEPRRFLACALPERMARIAGRLDRDYVLVDRIADPVEPLQIFERRDFRASLPELRRN
jgi:hypothetical protein